MRPFAGFPTGKLHLTPIPGQFFAELLPAINDLDELKLTLFMFWFLHRQRGQPRYMTLTELESEGVLVSALVPASGDSKVTDVASVGRERLRSALERAVARGTLLQIVVEDETGEESYVFLNTPQGRKAVADVRDGRLLLERIGRVREVHVERPRPNIYQLYEDNIGLLQPLLAEELAEAASTYPEQWIEEAFRIAVERNARNWRYVRGILERWTNEGRDVTGGRYQHTP